MESRIDVLGIGPGKDLHPILGAASCRASFGSQFCYPLQILRCCRQLDGDLGSGFFYNASFSYPAQRIQQAKDLFDPFSQPDVALPDEFNFWIGEALVSGVGACSALKIDYLNAIIRLKHMKVI